LYQFVWLALALVVSVTGAHAESFPKEESRGTTWTGPNWGPEQPRFVTDLNGDGKGDLVGFGTDGVWTALGKGDGTFSKARMVLTSFNSQGWHTGQHPRFVVDLNGDGKGDIIGFGDNGVSTAISKGDGTFAEDQLVLAQFGVNQGWRMDQHPRFVADLTGDGKADLVGFNNDGVWTALGRGDGTFGSATLVLANFGINQGWQVAQHPRFVADLTGDGKADLVGFGPEGVRTALGKGDGTFGAATLVLANFGVNQRWPVDKNPLFLADVIGSGRLDLVGFGDDGVWTASGNGDGTFGNANQVLANFGVNQGWQVGQHPRFVVDLTGDGKADILGFDNQGVRVALNNGDGTYGETKLVLPSFGINQGWQVGQHLRLAVDLNGDGKADIIGFGNDAVPRAVLNNGNGTFGPRLSSIADITNQPSSAVQHDATFEVKHKQISLADLQFYLNVFLSQVHLNLDSKDHMFGRSEFTLNAAANPAFGIPLPIQSTIELNGLNFAVYNYYFQDINSTLLTASLIPGKPLALSVTIPFETDGPVEIKVDGHTGHDIDFHRFNIVLRPELTLHGNSLDLFGFVDEIEDAITHATITSSRVRNDYVPHSTVTVNFRGETIIRETPWHPSRIPSPGDPYAWLDGIKDTLIQRFIAADMSVDAGFLWDNVFAAENKIKSAINATIYNMLRAGANGTDNQYRESLSTKLKQLLGIDKSSIITSVSSDSNALYIDYAVPR